MNEELFDPVIHMAFIREGVAPSIKTCRHDDPTFRRGLAPTVAAFLLDEFMTEMTLAGKGLTLTVRKFFKQR